jgi:hypothetical protein
MEWREFCDRLADLGDGLDGEGARHLANQVACWLTYSIGHDDPTHPVLFRSSDPVYQWGGPNADQVARRARIAADGVYRISGNMGSCEEFILQVKRGAAQSGGAGVALEVEASSLGLAPGDDIDLVLAASEPEPSPETPGRWLPLDAEASFVHIRDYYFDWQAAEPATFVIERLDTQGRPAAKPGGPSLLDAAIREIEHSLDFWSGYQDRMLGDQPPNTFSPPAGAARGVQGVHYSHSGVALAPDEALVVELDAGGAPLWDIQLYSRPWYEALDFANRLTCLNHALAGPGPIVVAGRDPGGANWLDTEGRDQVLCTVRWWRAAGTPAVDARVVRLADLDLPPVNRVEQIRRRSAHIAWRYRT